MSDISADAADDDAPSARDASAARRRPRVREQQKELTRQRLVDAAVEVFEEKGYQSSTIEDITQRANVSRTTFYLHFNTKRDVAIANGDRLLARFPSRFAGLARSETVTAVEARSFLESVVEMMGGDAQANIIAFEANVADAGLTAKGWQDYLELGQQLLDAFLENGWVANDQHAVTHLSLILPTVNYALWGQGIFALDAPSDDFMDVLAAAVVDAVHRAVARP